MPSQSTGWEQASGATVSFTVPYDWTAGRIWGRTECNFSVNPGPSSCVTGGCNGGFLCDAGIGTARTADISLEFLCAADGHILQGVPPVSLAEWTLGVNGKPDFYDVSLVDGSNLPMTITSNKGCPTASCPVDLNPACEQNLAFKGFSLVRRFFICIILGPPELAYRNANGVIMGCKSSCFANLSGDPGMLPFFLSLHYDRYWFTKLNVQLILQIVVRDHLVPQRLAPQAVYSTIATLVSHPFSLQPSMT